VVIHTIWATHPHAFFAIKSMSTERSFYIGIHGQQQGPYPEGELRKRAAEGSLPPDTLIWREGMSDWASFSDYFSPQPSDKSEDPVKYPGWSLAAFAFCVGKWRYHKGQMSDIEKQAIPYINEYNRMSSIDYGVSVFLESMMRGALGDPFGKAHEEYSKGSQIEDRLSRLSKDYDSASSGSGTFFLLMIVLGIVTLLRHLRYWSRLKA
jgi:hypothetical protein